MTHGKAACSWHVLRLESCDTIVSLLFLLDVYGQERLVVLLGPASHHDVPLIPLQVILILSNSRRIEAEG